MFEMNSTKMSFTVWTLFLPKIDWALFNDIQVHSWITNIEYDITLIAGLTTQITIYCSQMFIRYVLFIQSIQMYIVLSDKLTAVEPEFPF